MKGPHCECPIHACEVAPRDPKNVRCRPCAVGNHSGRPCDTYARAVLWHLDKACVTCGFDSSAHKENT